MPLACNLGIRYWWLYGVVEANPLELFDSTLRDGEQGARRTLTPAEKAAIAERLECELGVAVIDAGFPGASPLDFQGARAIAQHTASVRLSLLSHGTPNEIRLAADCLADLAPERLRLATFHRPLELSTRHASAPQQVRQRLLRQARTAVRLACGLAPEVQYYLLYSGDRDPRFLAELADAASEAGATHIVVADSQSTMTPGRMRQTTAQVIEAVAGRAVVGVHCHNQLGLALANSLAGLSAGATQVEACLLGIGDAGGNLATEQLLAVCRHAADRSPQAGEDLPLPACQAAGSLPAAVALAREVAERMRFSIGENQPIVGERSFTCSTGIHQDNLQHLGHTAFQPERAGRSWTLVLNRHSSRRTFRQSLQGAPDAIRSDAPLLEALHSWLKHQRSEVVSGELEAHAAQLQSAFAVIRDGGVAIVPTTVGYTFATSRGGVAAMKAIKGRPAAKPCGILATTAIFEAVTGFPLEPRPPADLCLACLSEPSGALPEDLIPADCIAPDGRIGLWFNLGLVHDYIASRLWSEKRQLVVGSSCNRAGYGNAAAPCYDLAAIDPDLRSAADLVVSLPHWLEPHCDERGHWLSAPILDLRSGDFQRLGRMQAEAERFRAAWQSRRDD